MATNIDYNVNVNATNGIQALNNLQNKVQGLNSSLSGMKNAIAGLAFGAAISSLLRFADGIQDLSDATGIATQNILGFQKAVQAFGGNADVADKAILKLTTNIGAAADGSAELQGAFGKVGVTLNDLATLSEQDILMKTIQGLEKITDKSEQAYLKQQLLGKEFRNVATSGLAEAYKTASEESKKYADSIKSAAETQQKLETAIGKVKLAALEALKPFADFVNKLDDKQIETFTSALVNLAGAAAAIWALVKAFEALKFAATILIEIGTAAWGLFRALTPVGRVLSIILAGFMALSNHTDFLKGLGVIFDDLTGKKKDLNNVKTTDTSEQDKKNAEAAKEAADKAEKQAEAKRKLKAAVDELKNSLSGIVENYKNLNQQNIEAIKNATWLMGVNREEARIQEANIEINKKAQEEIQKLEDKKKKLNDAEKQQGGIQLIDQTIAKIKQQAETDKMNTEEAIRNSESRIRAYDLEKFAKQSQIDVENDLKRIQDDIAKSTMSEIARKEYEILAAARDRADAEIKAEEARRNSLLTDAEKLKYYEAAKKGTEKLIEAERKAYSESRTFSYGWNKAFREYVDNATNAARAAERIFQKATQGMEDLIVNFVKTGKFEWKGFVQSMLEELLRSQIQQVLGSIMGSIGGIFGLGGGGDATGKGASPNDPLYVLDVSGGMGGGDGGLGIDTTTGGEGGGLFGGITGMAGKVWDTVKGIGGGIWDGIKKVGGFISDGLGSVWDGIKKVGGAIGGGLGSVWDGIKSVGSSIGTGLGNVVGAIGGGIGNAVSGISDFFGGFFAGGGQLGAGKWGIAGENGPELISGPASITPMGGTNVTYNINAVDAMSFKQMLAQDPSFIYALSLQGGGNIPSRR